MRQQLPWLGAVMIASTLGSIAILRLWLARSGTSVSEALRFAFVMIPTMIILFLVQSLLFGIAALLLIIPALYLIGRFAAVYPLLTDQNLKNPFAALTGSWQLTSGRSEEHTSELQSLMRISYAVLRLKKQNYKIP